MFAKLMLQNIRGKNYDIDFPKGVTCLLGRNGAGKSTIVESLCFSLFGSSQLRGSVDEFLGTDGVVGVEGNFPQTFQIARKPKKTVGRIDDTDLLKTTDVARFFSNTFGSKDIFQSIFVAGQNAVSEISTIRSGLRRKLLIELLGLATLNKAIGDYSQVLNGSRVPSMPVEPVRLQVAEMEKKTVKNTDDLYKLRDIKNELDYIRTSSIAPSEAREKLPQLETALKVADEEKARVYGKMLEKTEAYSIISKGETAVCPVCEQSIDAKAVGEKIKTSLTPLENEHKRLHDQVAQMLQVAAVLRNVKDRRDAAELEKLLPPNFDPETALRSALELSRARETLRALEDEWKAYNASRPKAELSEHLKAFEDAVLVKYFTRLVDVVSGYLQSYTPFKRFALNELTLDFVVDDRGLHTFSGGERDLICTCFRIAISQIVSEARFGLCPIAIFDSSFDSLDERNLLAVLELLRDSPFQQVIVTTHNEWLRSKLELNYVHLT